MKPNRVHLPSLLLGAVTLALVWSLSSLTAPAPPDTSLVKALLQHGSVVYLPDGQGNERKTLRFTGINVQLVSGQGATNGYPADPVTVDPLLARSNGLGNLIVGYNELGNRGGDERTGSHNIVCGTRNNFSSFGGLVIASDNAIQGAYASVSGGGLAGDAPPLLRGNVAAGDWSAVGGGTNNVARGTYGAVAGGFKNEASGSEATILGGRGNLAGGQWSTVSGGYLNAAAGVKASILGGQDNLADGTLSTVGGGQRNVADGYYSTVGGGLNRTISSLNASGNVLHDWVGGSLWEDR